MSQTLPYEHPLCTLCAPYEHPMSIVVLELNGTI